MEKTPNAGPAALTGTQGWLRRSLLNPHLRFHLSLLRSRLHLVISIALISCKVFRGGEMCQENLVCWEKLVHLLGELRY